MRITGQLKQKLGQNLVLLPRVQDAASMIGSKVIARAYSNTMIDYFSNPQKGDARDTAAKNITAVLNQAGDVNVANHTLRTILDSQSYRPL